MKLDVKVVLTIAAFAATAFAGDTPIKFSDMPLAVQKTIQKEIQATGAKIKNTLKVNDNGVIGYECESIMPNGRTRDFEIDPQGNLTESEDEVEGVEVPAGVQATVDKAAAGGGKITKCEAVKNKDGKLTGYEATVVKGNKKTGLEIDLTGKITHSETKTVPAQVSK